MKHYYLSTLYFIAGSALAQGTTDTIPATALDEIVISSLHVNDSLMRAPASIAVLSGSSLRTGNQTDISTVLNRVGGVQMQSGALNTNRVSIRGIGARTPFGTNKIRAFYGNIPLTSGDSETTIEDLDLQNLSRAEIIKGPLSSVYGAGLGGAILLTPENRNHHTASISSMYGSFGLRKLNARASASGKLGTVNFNHHSLDSDGWRKNSGYHREAQTLSGELFRTQNSRLSYLANHTYLKAFIPSSINKETFENDPRAAAPTWLASKGFEQYQSYLAGLNYDFAIGKFKNQTSVFLNSKNSNEPRPFDILKQNTFGYGARTQFSRKFAFLSTAFIVGGEFFQDRFNGKTFENRYEQNNGNGSLQGEKLTESNQRRSFYNAFGQLRFQPLRKIEFQAGINVNQTSFSLDNTFPSGLNGENYRYQTIWSPQLSVLFISNDRQTIYASVSRGFSLPSVEETLTASGLVNREIRPEIGTNFEIGVKNFLFGNKVYLEIAIYHMAIRDLLVARRVADDQYVGVNAGKTAHRGIEWLGRYRTTLGNGFIEWQVSGSFGAYTFKDFTDSETEFTGNRLPGVPNFKTATGIRIERKSGWHFSANFVYTGEMPMNDANTAHNDAFGLLDLASGWNVSIFDNAEIRFLAGVNNATDKRYASMVLVNAAAVGTSAPRYYYPGQPINYYGSFLFEYQF